MKKYDCSKAIDYDHEYKRLCSQIACCDCPLDKICTNEVSQKLVDAVQKWSDEHPEPTVKLTRREREFVKAFLIPETKFIHVTKDGDKMGRPHEQQTERGKV